jgi:hypothetical protein
MPLDEREMSPLRFLKDLRSGKKFLSNVYGEVKQGALKKTAFF